MLPQNLNPRQKEAVTHPGGPLLIAAGAGSGKTKTLTSRLLFLLEKGEEIQGIIAITFTNKAAREMAERVRAGLPGSAKLPFIGTFHSLGARILKEAMPAFGRNRNFTIFDDDDSARVVRGAIKRLGGGKKIGPGLVMKALAKTKGELAGEKELGELAGDEETLELLREVIASYEEELRRMNAFDFDDLIVKPVRFFRENHGALEDYRKKLRHILVDEFQDVNAAQYELVKTLAGEKGSVSAVGDDAQSIYRFRGANPGIFLAFEDDWPGTKVVLLEENYRSAGNIIAAANEVIAKNEKQKKKNLWTKNEPGEPVRIFEDSDPVSEAERVAESITERRGGNRNETVAVLYRTNAQSRPVEQALIERQLPYRIFGGLRFYERKEIKDLIACLRYGTNARDEISKERIGKNFPKRVATELVQELPEKAASLAPVELIGYILKTSDYLEYLKRTYDNSPERTENIAELIGFASNYKDLSEFLQKISLLEEENDKGALDANPVNLMSIHAAKGLEFDRVHLIGAAEGVLPHQMAYRETDGIEEERRLMYVAMTRAKRALSLSFSDIGSRFLYEIPPELVEFRSSAGETRDFVDDEERFITFD